MALLPPFFIDCVIAIGARPKGGGAAAWSASGFVYGRFLSAEGDTKQYWIYIVTNRHVFQGHSQAVLRFNPEGDQPAREFDIDLVTADGQQWLAHDDPDIDVAVLPISGQHLRDEGIQFSWFRSDQHVLGRQAAIDGGLSEGDGVFILGFPMGIVGGERNYVIVRQGCIARARDWLAGTARDYLVDVSVFPGNSGGPVVCRPDNTSITGTKRISAAYLIGMVKSYVPYRDVAVSQQTGQTRVVFEENSGLAAVVPLDYIIEVVERHAASQKVPPPSEEQAVPPELPSPEPEAPTPPKTRAKRGDAKRKPATPRSRAKGA